MKNVCFFNSLNFWGGGEKLHLEYAVSFKERGYNVCIFAYENGPLWLAAKSAGIAVYPVKATTLSFLNPHSVNTVAALYKKLEIDTVIFSTSQDVKLGGFAAKRAGIPRIVYLRGLAVPIKNSIVNRHLFKNIITHIAANSQATASLVTKHLKDAIDPKKLGVIYHGIEVNKQPTAKNFLASIEGKRHGIVLGNAGRLTKQKGQHHLIKVAALLKEMKLDFSLFIAGTGELESELKKEIEDKGLQKNVYLLGFVEDMKAFMQSIDVFLLSSEWEGFGYVIVEAMEKGKPVIAFDISSNPEVIDDGKTGFLVPYPNIIAFARETKKLIENESLRVELGKKGKEHVKSKFEISAQVDKFENFIKVPTS